MSLVSRNPNNPHRYIIYHVMFHWIMWSPSNISSAICLNSKGKQKKVEHDMCPVSGNKKNILNYYFQIIAAGENPIALCGVVL